MSLVSVRPYFRARLDSLNYVEWTDGFNIENIPQTILNNSYHLAIETIDSGPANQLHHEFTFPVTLRVFLRGYRDPAAAIDDAISQAETILAEVLSPSNRLGTEIKDVTPESIDVRALADSNDNDIVLEMVFNTVIDCNFT